MTTPAQSPLKLPPLSELSLEALCALTVMCRDWHELTPAEQELVKRLEKSGHLEPASHGFVGWNRDVAKDEARCVNLHAELVEALRDMLAGWQYIRSTHGELYGVGWDRAENKVRSVLAKVEDGP